jgi:hypothetical protein
MRYRIREKDRSWGWAECNYQWTARDKQLGTTGRRMGDPEYDGLIFLRGVTTPRSLADDRAALLTLKERTIFEYARLCAQADPKGHCGLRPEHIPAEIARMRGARPFWMMINLGLDGVVREPGWLMRFHGGEVIGGSLPWPASVTQETHVLHGTVVHHHRAEPEHVHHNYRSTW